MSWTSETWAQEDGENFSFPFQQNAGLAQKTDCSSSKTIWNFSNENFQFPYVCLPVPQADISGVKTIWHFHPGVNFSFPFIVTAEEIPPDIYVFPAFVSFSLSGIGADFKAVSKNTAVSLPEHPAFRFRKSDAVSFRFPKNQEMIL